MTRWTMLAVCFLGACEGGPGVGPGGNANTDRQIDGLPAATGDISAAPHAASGRMCINGDGQIFAMWRDNRDGFFDVWFNRSDDGGETWLSDPVRVKQGGGDALDLQMACVADRVYAVWTDTRDSETEYTNIYFNFSTDGGDSWREQDVLIDDDPDGRFISINPQIVLSKGRPFIIWADQVAGAPDIYAVSSGGGPQFTEPVRLSNTLTGTGQAAEEVPAGESWSGNPRAAADEEGYVYVVWEDKRNGAQDVYFTVTTEDGSAETFRRDRRVNTDAPGSAFAFSPRVAASQGNAFVVWQDARNGADRDIYMRAAVNGGTALLSEDVRIDSLDAPGQSDSINPSLLVRGSTAHIVWQDAVQGAYDIYHRPVTVTEGLLDLGDAEVRVENSPVGSTNAIRPRIFERAGDVIVGWEDRRADQGDQGFNELYYNHLSLADAEPAWGREDLRLDSNFPGETASTDLQLATHSGFVQAIWTDNRQGRTNVYFSRSPIGGEVVNLADVEED